MISVSRGMAVPGQVVKYAMQKMLFLTKVREL